MFVSARTEENLTLNAEMSAASRRLRWLLPAAAFLALFAVVLLAAATPASAGSCVLGPNNPYEIDDDYPAPSPLSCQYKTFQQVMVLALVPGDVIKVYNGTYNGFSNVTTNGLSFVGESERGVKVDASVFGGGIPFVVRAWDTNITNMTLIGSSWALDVDYNGGAMGTTNRTFLANLTLQASSYGCVCWGLNMRVRNVTVTGTFYGYHSNNLGLDLDGLRVNSTGSQAKLYVGGTNSVLRSVTLWGSNGSYGLFVYAGNNVSFFNLQMENSSTGVYDASGAARQVFDGLSVRNVNVAYYSLSSASRSLSNFAVRDSNKALQGGSAGQTVTITGGDFRNLDQAIDWETGSALTVRDTFFENVTNKAIYFTVASTLTLTNVSMNNVWWQSVDCEGSCLNVVWDGGSVNATGNAYVHISISPTVTLRNLRIENTSDWAIFFASWTPESANFIVENCTLSNVSSGIYVNGGSAPYVANNTVTDSYNTGLALYSSAWGRFYNNTLIRVGIPMDYYPSGADSIENYHDVPANNTADGRPIYFLLNASNVTVPPGGAWLVLINCTNVSVSGLNETAASYGAWIVLSTNITLADSLLAGVNGLMQVLTVTGLRLDNITNYGQIWGDGIYLGSVTNANLTRINLLNIFVSGTTLNLDSCTNITLMDSFSYNRGSTLYSAYSTRVRVINVTQIQGQNQAIYLYSTSDVLIRNFTVVEPADFGLYSYFSDDVAVVGSTFVNASSIGVYAYASARQSLFEVLSIGPNGEALAFDSSDNVTVRNSTFASEFGDGAYLYDCPDFRSFNSTYASANRWSLFVDSLNYNALFVHNNFYGAGPSDTNGLGTWHGGYPTAGNYYAAAAGAFLDEKTGPGQNAFPGTKDGIKDAPVFPIGGGKNDNYALMDPWPPTVALTSPPNASLVSNATLLNFSVSNFFDLVTWRDNVTGTNGTLAYPHDLNTTGWADGWHTVTITATDGVAPTVVRSFSFELDSTPPIFVGVPPIGTIAVAKNSWINITVTDAHLNRTSYRLDGNLSNLSAPWSISTAGLAVGSHTLDLFANDTLNNTRVYNWTFYVDDTLPRITLANPLLTLFVRPGRHLTFNATDDFSLDRVSYVAVSTNASGSYSGLAFTNASLFSVDTTGWNDSCYTVTATAVDTAGHTNSTVRQFCVDSRGPDLHNFVGGFAVDEDVLFTFDGNLVRDLDWAPTFSWTFDDAVFMAPTTLTGPTPTWTFPTPGSVAVTLTVTDRAGNSNSTTFTMTVVDTTNPVAAFTLPATWPEDVSLVLRGENSTDNNGYWNGGAGGNFSWNVTGPYGSWTVYGLLTNITLGDPGDYLVTLTATDPGGNFNLTTRSVRIVDTHAPSIALTGTGAIRNEGDTVFFNASGSTDNDPASPLIFHWAFTYGGAPVSLSTPTMSFRFDTPGTYAITLTVADAAGNEASQPISQRINDIPAVTNAPPTSMEAGNIYEWTMVVADTDTADPKTFTLLSGPSGMTVSTAGVVQWTTTSTSYGVYDVSIRISDGIASPTFDFVLRVTRPASGVNHPPLFTSFPVQTGTPGASYAYTATFSDPDGADLLTLVLLSGPAGMTLDSSHILHWQIPTNATENSAYQVQLMVSDGLEFVYQNFTIRVRTNNQLPQLVADKVPSTVSVGMGQTIAIVLTADMVTDGDDAFGNLTFYAIPTDVSAISVQVGLNGDGQPTLFVTGLKAGTTTLTLRVADPSGASASKELTATVSPAASTIDMSLLLLIALLVGAGVVGLVLVKRRKKDEGEQPLAPPAPAAATARPAAEEVRAEVIQVAPAAAVAAPLAAAVAVRTAPAAAAALPRTAPPPAVVAAPAKPSKAATYVIEGVFVIYQDGRMIYSKTDIGQQQLGDPELVSSMFTAVQQFIKDSFSAEGELNKMGYGENQILIERGNHLFMAVITYGEPDKELQETMQTAIEKMEYAYAGVVEAWDGQQNRFKDLAQLVAPLLALTAGVSRQDVLAATTTKDVKILSQLEFFQGFVRLKVGIKNDTEAVITKVTLDIDYNEDVLRLQRIEPASYKTSGARVMLNVLNPGEKSSVAYYFDPQICTETNIDGILRYRDYKGVLASVTMKTRKAEVVCPLFFTKEHANTAMLKRLIETELQERDSKIYTITKLPPYVKHKDIFDVCKQVVLSHDVHMVREFVSYNPFAGEAWFYGETKVKGYKIVIRTAVREDNTVEFFAASSVIKAVTGLLAEFNHTLVSMIMERYSDVKLEQVYDENIKHQIQSKALIDKLGEGEAGAGETDQR